MNEFVKEARNLMGHKIPEGKILVKEGNTQPGDLCWLALRKQWVPVEVIGVPVGNYYGVIRDVQGKSS